MFERRVNRLLAALGLVALCTPVWAGSAARVCQGGKNTAAGAFARCRQQAYAKYAVTADAAKLSASLARCASRYAERWLDLEAKAVAANDPCPSTGDLGDIQAFVEEYTANVAAAVAGGPLLGGPQALRLRTGVTGCWNDAGVSIPCAGTGQDGEVQAGLAPFHLDLGDGTVFDTRTGLIWEKQSDDGSIHDRDDTYVWSNAATKIAALNAARFAGYDDWRLPNVNELHTLVSYAVTAPATPLAFNVACTPGCDGITCSCSAFAPGFYYWSGTPSPPEEGRFWALHLDDGTLTRLIATAGGGVRAVRGGL